jgi:uncharacterized membrane protein YoaK (UPF0700 family)
VDADARRIDVNLTIAGALAFVAGCVDAICFDRVFAVFPANQSGNAVLLGIALGRGDGGHAWRPAVAIVGFALGVALGILLGSRLTNRSRPELLVGVEVAMLIPVAVVVLDDAHPAARLGAVASGVLVAVTACAMGVQTEVIGRVAGTAVATTYQTGAITRMAEAMARRVAAADRRPAVVRGLVILAFVLVTYVGGAAAGAGMGSWRGAMFVPMAVLLATGVLAALAPAPPPARADAPTG